MPFRGGASFRCQTTASVADAVSFELDRMTPAVTNLSFLILLELVMTISRQQQEPLTVPDVLHVGETAFPAIGSLPLSQCDFVLRKKLLIDAFRVLFLRNSPGHIIPVTMSKVTNRDLLNEALRGCCDAAVRPGAPGASWPGSVQRSGNFRIVRQQSVVDGVCAHLLPAEQHETDVDAQHRHNLLRVSGTKGECDRNVEEWHGILSPYGNAGSSHE